MSHLSFRDKLSLKAYNVVLCTAKAANGEAFFHYLMADKPNIEKMHRDQEAGKEVDFTSYGEILLSGWGEKPAPEYEMIISEYFQPA